MVHIPWLTGRFLFGRMKVPVLCSLDCTSASNLINCRVDFGFVCFAIHVCSCWLTCLCSFLHAGPSLKQVNLSEWTFFCIVQRPVKKRRQSTTWSATFLTLVSNISRDIHVFDYCLSQLATFNFFIFRCRILS